MVGRAEFEQALRYDERLLTAAANVAIPSGKESVAVAIPCNPKVPDADPDREVIWTVDGNAVRFDLSALRAKPAVAVTTTTVLDSTNSVVFSVGSTLCMLARTAASETAASQFLFSADRADTYSVELAVSSIDLEPWARRSNTTAKVAAAKLPPRGLTQAQVDARIAALDHPVDAVASKPLTLTGSGGRLGVVNLALPVTVGGVRYTIGQVVHDSSRIVIEVTPIASVAKLGPYHVQIGTTRLAFATARISPGDTSSPDVYEWKGAYPSWGAAGDKVTLTIYEPLGPENFVPRGADGDNGKVLKRTSTGPAWGTLAYSLGGKVADMALTTGAAATYPLNGIVPRSFAHAASGYAPDAAGVLRVPKAGQVIGWMFKSLVGGTVIDTVTVPKMSRTVGTDAFGPPIQLTFKNNGRSDVHLSFRSQTNSNYHKLDVRGNGNEIPAQATIEVYEWV